MIKAIKEIELPNDNSASQARDYYMLSFYLIGISFTDLAYLTNENIMNNRIIYKRRKTGTQYNIKLLSQAKQLIDKYCIKGRKYLLPILPDTIIENGLQAKKLTPHQFNNVTVHQFSNS